MSVSVNGRRRAFARSSPHRESEKKQPAAHHEGHSLEAFRDRRRDLCGHDLEGAGHDRTRLAKDQAERACAVACTPQSCIWSALNDVFGEAEVGIA